MTSQPPITTPSVSGAESLALLRALGSPLKPRLLSETLATSAPTVSVHLGCGCGFDHDETRDAFGCPPGGCYWTRAGTADGLPWLDLHTAPREWSALDRDAPGDRYLVSEQWCDQLQAQGAIPERLSTKRRRTAIPMSLWLTGVVSAHAATEHLADYQVDAWAMPNLTAVRITWHGQVGWYVETDDWLDAEGNIETSATLHARCL
ncbi:hypothetical protein [Knoellia sp. LjRoot47]|uniref:hypothetical protein n=1 Tax=Knoellia sp. LjRoot47 TaxID=3342330 RepID=UPI003ECCAEBA